MSDDSAPRDEPGARGATGAGGAALDDAGAVVAAPDQPPEPGGRLRAVHRTTIATVATGLSIQAALVVSGPIVARLLGVADRGYFALLVLFATVVSQLGSLGVPQAIPFFVADDARRGPALARALLRPVAVQIAALTAVHAVLVALYVAGEPAHVARAAWFTLAAVPGSIVQQYGLAFLQGHRRFRAFNALRLTQPAGYAVALAALFVAGDGDLALVCLVWVCALAAVGVAAVVAAAVVLASVDDPVRDAPALRDVARFGLRGLLGSVSPVDTFRIDQAVVGLFLSPAALGLYVVGLAFTNLPRFMAQSMGMVAYPHVAAQTSAPAARRSTWAFFYAAAAACAAVVAALEIAAPQLVTGFFGDDFAGATTVTRILLLSALFAGARRVLADGARGAGRPGLVTVGELASWAVLAPALALLAPRWGLAGVAWALVASSAAGLAVSVAIFGSSGDAPLLARRAHAR
ncbi:MAG TPA: lipopolysaccharide biosynthesis protein [Actinomycetota bacterium]|nr:lipopolysaccharide biosynthesis protein [Actinomycetota bacterium]